MFSAIILILVVVSTIIYAIMVDDDFENVRNMYYNAYVKPVVEFYKSIRWNINALFQGKFYNYETYKLVEDVEVIFND